MAKKQSKKKRITNKKRTKETSIVININNDSQGRKREYVYKRKSKTKKKDDRAFDKQYRNPVYYPSGGITQYNSSSGSIPISSARIKKEAPGSSPSIQIPTITNKPEYNTKSIINPQDDDDVSNQQMVLITPKSNKPKVRDNSEKKTPIKKVKVKRETRIKTGIPEIDGATKSQIYNQMRKHGISVRMTDTINSMIKKYYEYQTKGGGGKQEEVNSQPIIEEIDSPAKDIFQDPNIPPPVDFENAQTPNNTQETGFNSSVTSKKNKPLIFDTGEDEPWYSSPTPNKKTTTRKSYLSDGDIPKFDTPLSPSDTTTQGLQQYFKSESESLAKMLNDDYHSNEPMSESLSDFGNGSNFQNVTVRNPKKFVKETNKKFMDDTGIQISKVSGTFKIPGFNNEDSDDEY